MMRSVLAAFAMWCALSAPASADQRTDADLRCMALGLLMASSPEHSAAGMLATLYYLGRIDGRSPDFDLETELYETAARMDQAAIRAEGQRCSAEMMIRGRQVQELGDRMQQRAAQDGRRLNP